MPADGLAPLGARPSAGKVMAKFGSQVLYVYGTGIWLKELMILFYSLKCVDLDYGPFNILSFAL